MDDLISRKALLDTLKDINETDYGSMSDYRAHMAVGKALRDVCRVVDAAPAIDAEPVRHGEWGETQIIGYDGRYPVYAKPCSECGHLTDMYMPRFCPDCGARMMAGGKKDG